MAKYSNDDHYIDPETGVLKNRLGIADEATLQESEAAYVAIKSFQLSQTPLKGNFDLGHLQVIHRHLFSDVYEWAGELRTIDISKGGHMFAHRNHIQSAAAPVFKGLVDETHLEGLEPQAFSERAAHYLGELNALHPFREGNGRAQREFISHLAQNTGYYIAWENVKQADMLEASIQSFKGDSSKLAAIIRDNISRRDRDAAAPTKARKPTPPTPKHP